MVTLYDVPPDALIDELADRLADELEEPEWVQFATTGPAKELPPQQDDFWYRRAGALLRTVAIDGPVGVERLAVKYGDKKRGTNRYTVAKARQEEGARKPIRVALQQLEELGYVETAQGEGRRITAEGRSFLDDVAGDVLSSLDRPELERYA